MPALTGVGTASSTHCCQSTPGRLRINCPLHRPDSRHPPSSKARPPTAVGRSPAAPSPVGPIPRACGLSPGPSSPMGLCSAPDPPFAAEDKKEAQRSLDWGRPQPPPPAERIGRVGLWEFHWFKNTQRKPVRGCKKGEGEAGRLLRADAQSLSGHLPASQRLCSTRQDDRGAQEGQQKVQ